MKIEDWTATSGIHDYLTEDLEPRKIDDVIEGLLTAAGENPEYGPDAADIDVLIHYVAEVKKWREEVLQPAVDGLIEVHVATGIDLKNWGPVLNLVQSSNPEFSIVGEEVW